jgi:hypothetical protein
MGELLIMKNILIEKFLTLNLLYQLYIEVDITLNQLDFEIMLLEVMSEHQRFELHHHFFHLFFINV